MVDRNIVASTHRCNSEISSPSGDQDSVHTGGGVTATHGERVLARQRVNRPWDAPDWAIRYAQQNAGWLDSIYRQWWDDGVDEMPEGPTE